MKKIIILSFVFCLLSVGMQGQNKIIVKVDSSSNNELIQDFVKTGNTISILDAGGWRNINISNTAPEVDQFLKWNGTNWVAAAVSGGGGGTDSQTLSTNGSAGNISILNGNTITLNVNDADASATNEIQSLSKSGNAITLSSGGSVNLSQTNTPSEGQVLKWTSGQWQAGTDLTGGGGGGQLYTQGAGINVNNTTFVITNTGDLSDNNEIQGISKSGNTVSLSLGGGSFNISSNTPSTGQVLKWNGSNWIADTDNTSSGGSGSTERIGVSQSVANGGRIMLYDGSGFSTGTGTDIIINGANAASVSTSTNGGNITFTIDHRNVLSKSGNTVSGSNGGGSFNIASNTPSAGQVLKWSGTNWIADSDLTGGGGGGQQYASGDGIVVNNTNFTISALDISPTNEIDNLRVSSSVTGGGRLQNSTNGFNQPTEIGLIITGATASVTTGTSGNITWTLPDASATNELQTISSSGNSFTLSNSGGTVNIAKSGTATSGRVLKWDGFDWTYGTDENTTYTAGSGLSLSGTQFSATDPSLSNELITQFSKPSGNVIRIVEAGVTRDINISETTPNTGQVLKWNGSQWTAQDDATGGGSGGGTYSGGSGISVDNINNIITNTGDLSATNEGVMSLTGSSSPYTYNSNTSGSTPLIIAAGSGMSISRSTNTLTFAASITDTDDQTLSKSGNTISISEGNSINISQTVSPSNGQVLKWDGTQWNAATDNNTTYTQGTGISISGNVISSTVTNTDAQTLSTNNSPGNISISGGNTITLNVNDADASTTNEIQNLQFNTKSGSNVPLQITGSNTVDIIEGSGITLTRNSSSQLTIASNIIDTDGQTLTANTGTPGSVSISGGNTVVLNVNDADASTTNEIQNLTFGTKTSGIIPFNISGGGVGVNIVDGTGISIARDATNQITINSTVSNTDNQTISTNGSAGNISISGGNSITLNVNDADASTTNEAQTLSAGTNTINLNAISGIGGGSVSVKTINGTTILGSGDITTSDVSIYNANGSIPSTTTRTVTIPSTSSLNLGSFSTAYLELNNGGTNTQLGYGNGGAFIADGSGFYIEATTTNNTGVSANSSGLSIRTGNNNTGSNGQVLTSNGTYSQWQNNPALDGIYQSGGPSITFSNGSDASVFSGAVANFASVASSTTWTKSSSSAIYEVDLCVSFDEGSLPGNGVEGKYVTLGLYRSGSLISQHTGYTVQDLDDRTHDIIFKFVTDGNSGNLTFRNMSGVSATGTVSKIIIKRIM